MFYMADTVVPHRTPGKAMAAMRCITWLRVFYGGFHVFRGNFNFVRDYNFFQ